MQYGATDYGRDVIRFQDFIRFQTDVQFSARVFLARVLWVLGLSDQAISMAEKSLEEAQATGHAMSQCYALALSACPISLWTGNLDAQCVTDNPARFSKRRPLALADMSYIRSSTRAAQDRRVYRPRADEAPSNPNFAPDRIKTGGCLGPCRARRRGPCGARSRNRSVRGRLDLA